MEGPQQVVEGEARGGRGARKRILEAAARLFYQDGINATGVERLASEAQVSKRTLYQHFPSKAAVVEEYLRGMQQWVGDPVGSAPRDADRTPRARLLAVFDRSLPPGQLRGCPFHNAAVEAAEAMPEVQDIVHRQKQEFIDSLIALAKQAGATNPRLLGQQLAVLYEGAAALGTSLDDPAPWTHARKAAQVLIDQALKT
ncbi:MAG: TetR/AcrR family transcriptional regulator [Mycobacterium sp.]|nr:TetR/AcrR family transcriptional regulator [Mycobacterium sp.]